MGLRKQGEVTYKDISGFQKWFLITLISMGSSVVYTPMYLKGVFYDPLQAAIGCTNAELGLMVSVYGITAMICYLPSGIVADKFRMRHLASVGFIGTAILTWIYALMPSVMMCYVLFVGMGITSILIWWGTRFKVVRLCCAEEQYPAHIGTSYSIYGVAGLIIGLVNVAIAAAIPDQVLGMQAVLIFLGAIIFILGVLSILFMPNFKGEINKDSKLFSLEDAIAAIKYPGVLWCALGYMMVYGVYQGATYTTPYLSQALGVGDSMTATIGLIRTYGIGLLAGPVLGIVATKLKSSSKTIFGCFAFAIVILIAFILVPQDPGMGMIGVVLTVLFGFFTYGAFSIGSSPLSEVGIPMSIFGTAVGVLSVIGYLPDVFIHTWYGSILDASGIAGFSTIFIIEIVLAVIGMLCMVMAIRAMKKHAATQAAEE